MKILVMGSNAAGLYVIKQLLNDARVETVYHWLGADDAEITDRYIPVNPTTRARYNIPETLDEMVAAINVDFNIDFVISFGILFSLSDYIHKKVKEKNIPAFMAPRFIANLEWSKTAGKMLLTHLQIPTPAHKILKKFELVKRMPLMARPYVIKYEQDWRHGEQTIIVTDDNYQDVFDYITSKEGSSRSMKDYVGEFMDLTFVVEEFVTSTREYSYHAVANATGWKFIGAARDYKKRYEGDLGHNTVGMGAYSIGSDVDPIVHEYTDKIISYLSSIGKPFLGVLYLGIMVNEHGVPIVLEINTRFGDPELFAILPKINNNLLDLLYNTASGKPIEDIKFNNKSAVAVRVINKDYHATDPEAYKDCELGSEVDGIEISGASEKTVLHSVVSTTADTITEASDKIYKFLATKSLGNYTYRKDIGYLK